MLATCLVTNQGYRLVWFPTTLKGAAYEWYRNHAADTFATWEHLQRDFLNHFRPEVGQSAALRALAAIRQGRDEDMTSYIRRFELVCTRFVGTMLNDDTLRQFFIQGFAKDSFLKGVLERRPATLMDAKGAAREVEAIDKEHERLWRREDQTIPSFIPIHPKVAEPYQGHPGNSTPMPLNQAEPYPQPLGVRAPPDLPALTYINDQAKWKDEFTSEVQSTQKVFQDQIAQQMKLMTEQMALLIKNQGTSSMPPPIESGRHASGLWCTRCRQSGHSEQFCPTLSMPPPGRQPYENQGNANAHYQQGYDSGRGQSRPRYDIHHYCGKRHAPGNCWVENRVVCSNCGGNHPSDVCRRPDKVIPLNPPPGNYYQQAQDNMRGARYQAPDNTLRPPNMFYDHANNRQNQNPPSSLQTRGGYVPIDRGQSSNQPNQPQSSQGPQDVRFVEIPNSLGQDDLKGKASSSYANFVNYQIRGEEEARLKGVPALAVMTRSRQANANPDVVESDTTSEDSPHFSDLEMTTRKVVRSLKSTKVPTQDREEFSSEPIVPLERTTKPRVAQRDESWEGPAIPESEVEPIPQPTIPTSLSSYDLWSDLKRLKADITIAQLLEIAPLMRKALKSGNPVKRRPKSRSKLAASVKSTSRPHDVKAVEIEVSIVDKILPNTLVDGGSGLNIMPLQTMEKLGLDITGPSPFVINMANQSPEAPMGQIKDCKVMTGGEEYSLTFHVIRMHSNKDSFPLLLGRPWLRAANAKVDWGGNKPHIVYGPSENITKVRIQPNEASFSLELTDSSNDELPEPSRERKVQKKTRFAVPESTIIAQTTSVSPRALKCIGPGLYDWEDNGEFTQWLAEHPHSESDDSHLVYFLDGIAICQEEDLGSNFTTVVDEISYEDVCGVQMDGTQLENIEMFLPEDELIPPLHFKKTSTGITVGTDVPIYPSIPQDWYRGPTEQPHAHHEDWKLVDVAFEGEEPKMIKVGVQLSDKEVVAYKALVMEYRDVFAWSYQELKGIPTEIAQHRIPILPGSKPVRQKERRMNPRLQMIVKAELEKLLQAGFIRPVEITDWVSPMVLVKKKNGQLRVCIDYRKLNKCTEKDHFPLPFVNTILEEVAGYELYTFMDGYSGYNQISIHPDDYHKTAFTTPWGTFIYVVMPFGLCNAPAAFQRAMTCAFSELLHNSMTVFIDDFSTQSSEAEHLECVRRSFACCRRAGIALNPSKIFLAVKRGVLLGHVVTAAGREPDPTKVEVIVNLQPPTNVKGVQRALGHIGWYREAIHDYATKAIPITKLLQKAVKFEWDSQCQEAFEVLKKDLSSYPVLRPPNWNLTFHVYCDASAVAVGSALCQPTGEKGKDYPVAFASRQLNAAEKNYTTTERECLAMIFSVKKFRHYLLLNPVRFYVDHIAIRYLVNKPDLSGRLARWVLLLEEFDYQVEYKPGKMHKQADHLSRLSEEENKEPIDDNLVDESLFHISSAPAWYHHIAEFLKTQQLPNSLTKNERRKVRINSRHFTLVGGHLYRRSIDGVLRRCVLAEEVPAILSACHDSACGGHFSGTLTGQKALRAGYYWPNMFKDAHDHARRCDACQRYAKNDLHMSLPLQVSLPLVPFEKWGIDFIGEIHPSSSRGMKHIIVATEYLTKWAEAKAVKTNDAKVAATFLFEQVITRFGCPKILISDRGKHFLNQMLEEMTEGFKINHRKTTPYHPQTNGHTERVNQTLVGILRKTVSDSKRDWDVKLPAALWAYRTTYKVTTKATPFSLVYGLEAILPIEFEVPSLRIAVETRMPMSNP